MQKIKITFWKESYNPENSFVKDLNDLRTTATVTKTETKENEYYQIKFDDIGLDSLYGELYIERRDMFWVRPAEDTPELTLLKSNIICALMLQNV